MGAGTLEHAPEPQSVAACQGTAVLSITVAALGAISSRGWDFGEALQGKHVLRVAEPSPLETGNRSKFPARCTFPLCKLSPFLLLDCFPFPSAAADMSG